MTFSSRSLFFALGVALSSAVAVSACGSSDESEFGDGADKPPIFGDDSGALGEGGPTVIDITGDPLPAYCGPAGGTPAPQPTGTVACPSDKNLAGCGCLSLGETAPCWTGRRVNRNRGVCKDGITTCKAVNETRYAWGECVGEVKPAAEAIKGKDACKCFSAGQWKLKNLSPCFIYNQGSDPTPTNVFSVSTVLDNNSVPHCPCGEPGTPQCTTFPPDPAAAKWTSSTVKSDCAGRFTLCYALKAGKYEDPKATDCSLTKVCTSQFEYPTANVEMPVPTDLDSWKSADNACAYKWETEGGYGEMTIKGESVECDKIDDGAGNEFVFNRVKYCPRKCRGGANPTDPECKDCQAGGSGTF